MALFATNLSPSRLVSVKASADHADTFPQGESQARRRPRLARRRRSAVLRNSAPPGILRPVATPELQSFLVKFAVFARGLKGGVKCILLA